MHILFLVWLYQRMETWMRTTVQKWYHCRFWNTYSTTTCLWTKQRKLKEFGNDGSTDMVEVQTSKCLPSLNYHPPCLASYCIYMQGQNPSSINTGNSIIGLSWSEKKGRKGKKRWIRKTKGYMNQVSVRVMGWGWGWLFWFCCCCCCCFE